MYKSPVRIPSNQIHDFNPGIEPDGLFWTTFIPPSSVQVNTATGKASLHVTELLIEDYFNVLNALNPAEPLGDAKAHVSFDIVWSAGGTHVVVANAGLPTPFRGEVWHNTATLKWSATNGLGQSFTSTSQDATPAFAEVGTDRNGVFF